MKYHLPSLPIEIETYETFGGAWHAVANVHNDQSSSWMHSAVPPVKAAITPIAIGHGKNEHAALADLIRQLQSAIKEIDSL